MILRYRSPAGVYGRGVDATAGFAPTLVEQYNGPDVLTVTGPLDVLAPLAVEGSGVRLESDEASDVYALSTLAPSSSTDGGLYSEQYTLTYTSMTSWLWSRITYPDPSRAWESQTTAENYMWPSGDVESSILDLIDKNLGPGALPARRLSGLSIPASGNRGGTRAFTFPRFDPLGEDVAQVAEAAGLRVRIVDDGSGGLTVQVDAAADLSDTASYGTPRAGGRGWVAADWSIDMSVPDLTVALVAGSGQGTARAMVEVPDATGALSTYGRREGFVDQRQTGDDDELTAAGTDALTSGLKPVNISVTIPDLPGLRLGTDVPLGSVVGLNLAGIRVAERLRTVTTTWAVDGVTRVGGIGSDSQGVTRTDEQIRQLQRDMRRAQP